MIVRSLSRLFWLPRSSYIWSTNRLSSNLVATIARGNYATDQIELLKSAVNSKVKDWKALKTEVLSIKGSLNEKNVDGVLLKVMVKDSNFDSALSFAKYLINSTEELSLGVINGLLNLYHQIGLRNELTDEQKQFILDSYKKLYEKYEVLDSSTCESLLHALCIIDEWEKAVKVLDDIYLSSKPTHSAFSTLIATLFRINKKKEALAFIEKSIQNLRPLTHQAYDAWIEYVLRNYKTKDARVKHLEEICKHLSVNFEVMPEKTADKLKLTFYKLGWHARSTRIQKNSGQCVYCRSTLECLKLTEEEFQLLQKNVKNKLIVGTDVLLKSSETELKRFLDFFEETGPYDMVFDALNICYAVGKYKMDKIGHLIFVIEHFRQQNKKILLIGRKHMLKWPKMKYVMSKTLNFFTDDVSQDDPYFITATILSGSHTDFVSKDLLRGHRFQLQDEQLRHLFQRWQWQHQWKVFINRHGAPVIQPPLQVTPCAQKTGTSWHLPFESEESTNYGTIRDGTPDWSSWLCLQPSKPEEIQIDTRHKSLTEGLRQNKKLTGLQSSIEMGLQNESPAKMGLQNKSLTEMGLSNEASRKNYESSREIALQNGSPAKMGLQNKSLTEMGLSNEASRKNYESSREIALQNGWSTDISRSNESSAKMGQQIESSRQMGQQNDKSKRPSKENGHKNGPAFETRYQTRKSTKKIIRQSQTSIKIMDLLSESPSDR